MVTEPLTKKRSDCLSELVRLRECLLWILRPARRPRISLRLREWMASISMLATNECTFREAAIRASGMFSRISKKMQITTRPGAGTSFWSPELNRYYVAAPAHDNEQAAILVFEPKS